MAKITAALLKKIAPSISPALREEYEKWFNYYMPKYDITTERRVSMFFANLKEESGHLARLVENLNYSAKRLRQVWPRRFPTMAIAQQYAGNPQKLANYVYGGRNGNRGQDTNDGWTFRGRSLMQTTGRANYKTTGDNMGIDLVSDPAKLTIPQYAVWAACVEWKRRGCNELADANKLRATRKAINGGYNGMDHVEQFHNQIMAWLPDGFRLDNSPKTPPSGVVEFRETPLDPESDHVPDTATAEDAGSPAWLTDDDTAAVVPENGQNDVSGVPGGENAPEQQETAGMTQKAEQITNVGASDSGSANTEREIHAASNLPDTIISSKIKLGFNKVTAFVWSVIIGAVTLPGWIVDGITVDSIKAIGGLLWDSRYIIFGLIALWFVVNKLESIWTKKKVIDTNTDPKKGNVVVRDVEEPSLWQRIKNLFGGRKVEPMLPQE